jgi:hypothetical protein
VTAIRQALETHFGIHIPLSIRLADQAASPAPKQKDAPKEAPPAPSLEEEILKVADLFGGTVTP